MKNLDVHQRVYFWRFIQGGAHPCWLYDSVFQTEVFNNALRAFCQSGLRSGSFHWCKAVSACRNLMWFL